MDTAQPTPTLPDLQARLPDVMLRDERRLGRRLDGVRRLRDPRARERVLAEVDAELAAAEQRTARRRAAVPELRYPEELPVSAVRDEIAAAIRDHQVVVVAGETGSGKTTQLPKICLELGRGVRGQIGHTQPRRIAARTVAERIAEELGTSLGAAVGYKVRFTDRGGDDTLVKLMTDGILLAEVQNDRELSRYDTIIIDEAHERSLNVDFLLGYLKQLLPRRPDLKLVITSATIDPERFARHFGDAPVIEVSGRTYPVEVRYRPAVDPDDPQADDRDQVTAVCDAVEELCAEGPGDILVFLSGEREIRDTADALARLKLPGTELLPLYARLSAAEQHRVFAPHAGRRVVLATNVAETSLTVPGIRYVVDPGTARISRYSHRTKVQRLPIEPVSQASANQRKGRCGRTSEGICIRLYTEEDFASRPEFTDPEIVRTNLASVILQMTALGLGDLDAFPFVDPPDRRQVRDGVALLQELGALEPGPDGGPRRLTPVGRKLAQLPVDPRLARMVLAAESNGCLDEVMVIAAALSIQDPRERPVERQEAATQAHARFVDKESDFLAYLNLWRYLGDKQQELSSSAFRRLCRAEFLNYLRVREWQDIHSQLRQVARQLGAVVNDNPAEAPAIHQALLAGLLSHIGRKEGEKQEYQGARGAKFAIFPGSALAKKQPRWVMSAELVETSRLWARVNARIEPEWAEQLAPHLVTRSYSEPHWSRKAGAVLAVEKVSLYGLPIVTGRKVNYGRIDPVVARELFLRHALVEGDWETHHAFFHANRALLDDVAELEERTRRRDIAVDDDTLYALYDARVPADVVSARHFDSWWKTARRDSPELLTFTVEMLVNAGRGDVRAADYPDTWRAGDLDLPLSYRFDPAAPDDGVSVEVPLAALAPLPAEPFEWQVPGLREELLTALLRGLPKPVRRAIVPIPDTVRDLLAVLTAGGEPLLDAVERELRRLTGVVVPREAWQPDRVPEHLRMRFRIVDDAGETVAEGRDLAALKRRLADRLRAELSAGAGPVERTGLTGWDLDELPRGLEQVRGGYRVTVFPALVDEGPTVGVKVFATEVEAARAMWLGTRRLLLLAAPAPMRALAGRLTNQTKLALARSPHGGVPALLDDCAACAVDKIMTDCGGPARDADGFGKLRERVRAELPDVLAQVVADVQPVLGGAYAVERRLSNTSNLTLLPAFADIRAQLAGLVYPNFVAATGWQRLPDLPRYLDAIGRRLDRLPANAARDRELMRTVQELQAEYQELLRTVPASAPARDELTAIRWMIEELRVSLFGQGMRTPAPISETRIHRAMDRLTW